MPYEGGSTSGNQQQESNKKQQPRILVQCGHSICTQCIIDSELNGESGKFRVRCPECEVESVGESLAQFTPNLALMQLAEKRKQAITSSQLDLSVIKSDYSS